MKPYLCANGGVAMKGETKERWMELCAQAEVEQDPAKPDAALKD